MERQATAQGALHDQRHAGGGPLRHRLDARRQRRDALAAAAGAAFAEDSAGRVLPFDSDAAGRSAAVVAARRRAGNPIGTFDAQTAAITLAADAAVATRDAGGFAGCGLAVVDPWRTA